MSEEVWKPVPGYCAKREDGNHCHHWWDGELPCCRCGDNSNPVPDPEEEDPNQHSRDWMADDSTDSEEDEEKVDRRCIFLGYEDLEDRTTWCGRDLRGGFGNSQGEFVYHDATHALLSSRNGDNITVCRSCALAIAKQIRKAT